VSWSKWPLVSKEATPALRAPQRAFSTGNCCVPTARQSKRPVVHLVLCIMWGAAWSVATDSKLCLVRWLPTRHLLVIVSYLTAKERLRWI